MSSSGSAGLPSQPSPPSEPEPGSITRLIHGVQGGDSQAEKEMFERVKTHLQVTAKQEMYVVDPMSDEEDMLIMTYAAYLFGVASGRYRSPNRASLFALLAKIIRSRCQDHNRHAIAGIRDRRRLIGESQLIADTKGISVDQALATLLATDVSPEAKAAFEDEITHALGKLDPPDRLVAILRMLGQSTREISQTIDRSERSVERSIHAIKQVWRDHLER